MLVTCATCGTERPITEFPKEPKNRLGIVRRCRPCKRKLDRDYGNANRAARAARSKEWRDAHPERMRALYARWFSTARYKATTGAVITNARVKAKQYGVRNDLTLPEWREILGRYDGHCAYCHEQVSKLTMDHIVPMSFGGANSAQNVVPACLPCNSSKHNTDLVQWLTFKFPMAPPAPPRGVGAGSKVIAAVSAVS